MFALLSPSAGHISKTICLRCTNIADKKCKHYFFTQHPIFYLKNKNEKYILVHKYILDAEFIILLHNHHETGTLLLCLCSISCQTIYHVGLHCKKLL